MNVRQELIAAPPLGADPIFALIKKRAELVAAASAADRRMIAAFKAKAPDARVLEQAFMAAEEQWARLEDEIAETPATTLAGAIAKLQIPVDLYRDCIRSGMGSLDRMERRVVGVMNHLQSREPKIAEAIERLVPVAKSFARLARERELPSHCHLVLGALKDLRRFARRNSRATARVGRATSRDAQAKMARC